MEFFMELTIAISYETLCKDNEYKKVLLNSGISYYLISSHSKIMRSQIWLYCFLNGILPISLYTSPYWFKSDIYSYRSAILKLKTNNKILLVTDDMRDIDSIRDISNISYCGFDAFKLYIEKKKISKIEPFT